MKKLLFLTPLYLVMLVLFWSLPSCFNNSSKENSANEHRATIENIIKERNCYPAGGLICGQFEMTEFSSGKTKGVDSFIYKVKFSTISNEGKVTDCIYVHFSKEPGFDYYANIITGLGFGSTAGVCKGTNSCFGCDKASFNKVVGELGYSGRLPE